MREMKDSGVEWIGKIPSDWKHVLLKYVCKFKTGGTPKNKEGIDFDGEYPWITPNDFNESLHIRESKQKISHESVISNRYSLFPAGSTLLVCIASVGKVGIIEQDSYSNQQITALKPLSKIVPKFLMYATVACSDVITFKASSNVVPIINTKTLGTIAIPIPTLTVQTKIADFLDQKCSEIDALTADIQTQIETLEEYKKSVITEAVTKGLDPNVEMKDSGIEWIGMIPASWNSHPLYYYFDERKNRNFDLRERNLLSLSYGNIIKKDINTTGGLLPASFNTYNIVKNLDIIIRPTDLQNDKKSLRTGLVKEKIGIITSAYIALKPREDVFSNYFHYLLHSYDIMKVFYNMGNGVRQGLNYSEFSKLILVAPSLDEQHKIADFLDHKCAEIDQTISEKQQQLETLAEYKKSLIYEYVTGKKEVA